MSKRPTFVLPAGLEIDLSEGRLSLRFDGDLRLEQSLGRDLGDVDATGDLAIALEKVSGSLRAGGTLTVHGEVDAVSLHARKVVLGKKKVRCRAISASEKIEIGAAHLTVDAIVAPHIELHPAASGRVTVIESHNERGATKIKGGFSLADYDDMFGEAEAFLRERGLAPLSSDSQELLGDDLELDETIDEEDVDDPLSLSIDDIEPLADDLDQVAASGQDQVRASGRARDQVREVRASGHARDQRDAGSSETPEVDRRLLDALNRIVTCYEGHDLPPAVDELRSMVDQRDYLALRNNITQVWNGLLGYHQKRGIRPHHQVTHAFNVIHGLVQNSA